MAKVKAPAPKKVLSKETAKELSSKMLTSITIQNSIHLADKKKAPSIGFYEDDAQYFDPSAYAIHLGIYGPMSIFEVDNDEDYVAALQYLYGHENQHVRSTANAPYDNGIKRSAHAIIEYIAAKEGIRKNFRNDRDYEVFVATDLPAKNINISMRQIVSICSGLMNSVEDGRIERIRSLEFPGFERQRRYFRAKVWNVDHEIPKYSVDLTDADKLNLHMNNILSLATTGLYMKGFVAEYGATPIMDETRAFMPYIAKGVLAGRTRVMADNVVEIAKLLAPYIYAVCKYEKSEAQKAFEDLLKQLISQMISEMDPSKMAPTSEREEEQDDGIPMSVFPMSDLVITLDDETYDKLMEKAQKSGKGGGGIMVKREHPKEEEQKGEEGEGAGSGKGSKSDEKKDGKGNGQGQNCEKSDQGESGSSGPNGQSKDGDQNNNSAGNGQQNGQNGQNGQGNANSQSNQSSGNSQNGNGQSSSKDGSQPYDKTYQRNEGGGVSDGSSNQGSHQSGGGEGGSAEMVMDQMKKAAKECRDDVSDAISNINEAISHTAKTNRGNAPIIANKDKPITPAEMKDICARGFEEKTRMYKLDQPMPPVLSARAKSFRKRNERYFKSLSTPNVSHLDSGSVDPSRIYGLALGETDIFRRVGVDKKFDGCVYVLLDNSGSMCGNKRTEACKAAAVIEEGFKGIIPMKIVAFDTCGPIFHEVVKGWDESQKLNCCWNFAKHGRNGVGNDDAKDILVAQRELLSRPEQKKLLIVLSDGAPSSVEQTRQAIDETRKKGINVYGIYFEEGRIGSDAKEFQYMYQKDYVCCELSDVDTELTKLMIKFSRS
jgi:cobalamin biosynthesis protein CobT